ERLRLLIFSSGVSVKGLAANGVNRASGAPRSSSRRDEVAAQRAIMAYGTARRAVSFLYEHLSTEDAFAEKSALRKFPGAKPRIGRHDKEMVTVSDTKVTWLTQDAYDRPKKELDERIENRPDIAVKTQPSSAEGDLMANGSHEQ